MDNAIPKSVRYHALDIWRGIVCLVVVLEHAAVCLWDGGSDRIRGEVYWARDWLVQVLSWNLGAPLFFVISGYCIAASLDSTRRKGISPAVFLARRLWRIFPPYWASMLVIAGLITVLNVVGLRHWHVTQVGLELFDLNMFHLDQWIGNITLTETWRFSVAEGNEPRLLNRVAWALCYQEQFYMVCFLALVFAPRRLYKALAVATVAIISFRLYSHDIGSERYYAGMFPDLWHQFAIGLVLYWRINVAEDFWAKRTVEALLVVMVVTGAKTGLVTTQAAGIFGLMLLVFHRWDVAIANIKQLDPLRALGKRSYSVYLIHLPVCTVGNAALTDAGIESFWLRAGIMMPAVTAGSVLAGWIFYAAVDRHFGNLPIVGRFSRLIKPPQPGVAIPHAQV